MFYGGLLKILSKILMSRVGLGLEGNKMFIYGNLAVFVFGFGHYNDYTFQVHPT